MNLSPISFGDFIEPIKISGLEVDDRGIRRIQTGSTVAKVAAVPVAMIGLLLVGGPVGLAYGIGAAATAGAGVLVGKFAKEKRDELRAELERRDEEEFKRIFDEQASKVVELVEKAFRQVWLALQTKLKASLDTSLSLLNERTDESAKGPAIDLTGFRTKLADIRKRLLLSGNF